MMSSGFIHVLACVKFPFVNLNNILLYAYITFCLPIHEVMDTWVAFIFCLFYIMLQCMWVYRYLKSLLSILRGEYTQKWNC
jgi:hypothetical protein